MGTSFRVPTRIRFPIARRRYPVGLILFAMALVAWMPIVLIGYGFWSLLQ